jgi:hypothetical protein
MEFVHLIGLSFLQAVHFRPLTPATEDAAKDSRDRPTEDVIIIDSGEVSAVSTLGLRWLMIFDNLAGTS